MRYINDAMKKNDTPKDGLINRIIELEWDMFDKVTNTGGRAACQDDEWTFYVMRFSQFSALSEARCFRAMSRIFCRRSGKDAIW